MTAQGGTTRTTRPRLPGARRAPAAVVALVLLSLVLVGSPVDAQNAASDTPRIAPEAVDPDLEARLQSVPDEPVPVLARFDDETSAERAARSLADDRRARDAQDPAAGPGAAESDDVEVIDAAVPLVGTTADADDLDRLRATPGLVSITEDRAHTVDLATSVVASDVPAARSQGYTGAGTRVAVLDTGVLNSHAFVADRIVSEACFSGDPSDIWMSGFCPGADSHEAFGSGAAAPCDDHLSSAPVCWHGTHVTGIVAGDGGPSSAPTGVAPDAGIIAVQVFSRSTSGRIIARDSDLIAAMTWVASQQNATEPIVALNMSLSGPASSGTCDTRPADVLLKAQVDALRAVGITVIAASGNDYAKGAIGTPACISTVVAVGATNDGGPVTAFSNSSSALDLLAPGALVTSSRFTHDDSAAIIPGYGAVNGTSMAAPHVSGALAVLSQARGALAPPLMELALTRSGIPVTDQANGITRPLIQVGAAIDVALPPSGLIEYAEAPGSQVVVGGWAFDPDAAGAALVEVRVGGVPMALEPADLDRPDVFGALGPLGTAHGFELAVGGLPVGPHFVCVAVLDTTTSVRTPLGCQSLTVPTGPLPPGPGFADVPAGGPFTESVEWLADTGTTTGYPDGGFHPVAPVTREAVVAMLYRLAGEPPIDLPAAPTFSDVPATAPFHTEIEWAAQAGLVNGYGDGTFRPVEPISREAFAAVMWRWQGNPAITLPAFATFTDVPGSHPFLAAIEWMASAGIADGSPDGTFGTTDHLSRQALAAFLARLQLSLA